MPQLPQSTGGFAGYDELLTSYDIYEEEVARALGTKIPDPTAFSWMRKLPERMVPLESGRSFFSHWEDGEYFNGSVIISAKDVSVANQVTITLDAASHQNAGKNSFPTKNMLVVFPNQTVGFIIDVDKSSDNAHTITIVRQNSAQDVQAAAVVGQNVVCYSNQYEAGSFKNDGHIPSFDKVDHQIHTFRKDYGTDDHEMMNKLEFEANGSRYLFTKAYDDTMHTFRMMEEFGLLITPEAEDVTGPQKNKPIRSTKDALLPKIKAEGIDAPYSGNPDQTHFEEMELNLDKYYGDSEYLVGMGINAEQKLRGWLKTFTDGSDIGITFSGHDKQEVSIDFKALRLGSYTFHFDTWRALSHPGTLGASNMPYRWMMIFLPMGSSKVYQDAEKRNSTTKPYVQMRYQKVPGSNLQTDHIRKFATGGANIENPTSDELVKNVTFVSYKTLALSCMNKFAISEKSDL